MDLVITVSDIVANEVCPVLPAAPLRLHWGLPDPASVLGDEATVRAAFANVSDKLERHIALPVTFPFAGRDPDNVQADLDAVAELS